MKNSPIELLDKVLMWLVSLEDYFVSYKTLAVSELFLLWGILLWTLQFIFFDVQEASPTFASMISEMSWTICLIILSISHIVGIVFNSLRLRLWVCYGYSVFWLIWIVLAVYARVQSPVVGLIIPTWCVAIIVSVRLRDELHRKQ